MTVLDQSSLKDQLAVITGGAGLLGVKHAEAIAEAGGHPMLWDINESAAEDAARKISQSHGCPALAMTVDITDPDAVDHATDRLWRDHGAVRILINNAANDPKVGPGESATWSRFENFSRPMWDQDIAIGLTGAFLCSQAIGSRMAVAGKGVILNVASDLGVIAPDQRLYRKDGVPENEQPVKPVTYSVVKHGLIGLTKYLATYWADANVRVNAISPGGVYNGQPDEFVNRLSSLIPLGRMAHQDEYKAAIVFLCSEMSSYMTGQNLIMDGGRSVI